MHLNAKYLHNNLFALTLNALLKIIIKIIILIFKISYEIMSLQQVIWQQHIYCTLFVFKE